MYAHWWQQYLLAGQAGVAMYSNVCMEWSKGLGMMAAWVLPVANERSDAWLDRISLTDAVPQRPRPHVVNCAAGLYSRSGEQFSAHAANAAQWIACTEMA